jgi:hypothetical protein
VCQVKGGGARVWSGGDELPVAATAGANNAAIRIDSQTPIAHAIA